LGLLLTLAKPVLGLESARRRRAKRIPNSGNATVKRGAQEEAAAGPSTLATRSATHGSPAVVGETLASSP
jgi:hypothetical protein